MRIAFLVPCLNEERALARVLADLASFGLPIVVVDDGSEDRTLDIALANHVRVIKHAHRQGKGRAVRSGWEALKAAGFDGLITLDGDGQHRAEDVAVVLEAAQRQPRSLVIGARVKDRQTQPAIRRAANRLADWSVSLAAGQPLPDTQSGLRYYPAAVLNLDGVPADHFVFETATLVEASRRLGTRVTFAPIRARYEPSLRASHFRPVRDLLMIVGYVIGAMLRFGIRRRPDEPPRSPSGGTRRGHAMEPPR